MKMSTCPFWNITEEVIRHNPICEETDLRTSVCNSLKLYSINDTFGKWQDVIEMDLLKTKKCSKVKCYLSQNTVLVPHILFILPSSSPYKYVHNPSRSRAPKISKTQTGIFQPQEIQSSRGRHTRKWELREAENHQEYRRGCSVLC